MSLNDGSPIRGEGMRFIVTFLASLSLANLVALEDGQTLATLNISNLNWRWMAVFVVSSILLWLAQYAIWGGTRSRYFGRKMSTNKQEQPEHGELPP